MGDLEGIRSQSEVCSPPQAPKKSDFDVPNLGILWDPGGGGGHFESWEHKAKNQEILGT